MLNNAFELRVRPSVVSELLAVSRDVRAREAELQQTLDTLYPVEQLCADEDMMILWGDVSISARHPSRIAF